MKFRRMSVLAGLVVLLIALLSSGFVTSALTGGMAGPQVKATSTPPPFPDAYKLPSGDPSANVPGVTSSSPDGIGHPCSSIAQEPQFQGVSPLKISYPYLSCVGDGQMGDIATWQDDGHDYVGTSGFAGRLFFIYNVDDPYNPVLLRNEPRPAGSTASLSIFDWTQNGNQYLSVTTRGTGTGCGWFAYNVNDPANPVQVASVRASPDWCTVHEHFVSLDSNGDADYAWFTMSGESASEDKIVAMDISDLSNIVEVNRYERPDGASFIHDSNVVRGKLYVAHWLGGLQIFDKAAFVAGGTPTPLNPIDTIRPGGFQIHHAVPTSDDRYVLIQDEFINSTTAGKEKLYDIQNLGAPSFVADIIGGDPAANGSQAHNMIIKPMSAGLDLLMTAWYRAGIRGYTINTNVNPPTITQVFRHQAATSAGAGFGNVWGVDWLPCTVRGLERTCLYAGDMTAGLVVNAVNTDNFQPDPSLDPYVPNVPVITSPAPGDITVCSVTISGTAHDYWSGLQRVEVSTDNGGTWQTATGTETWSYQWNITGTGPFTIKARAFDMADNVANAVDVNVNVTANCSGATPTTGPSNTAVPPTNTAVNTATNTPVNTATNTPVNTATNTPVSTATSMPTETSVAPTETSVSASETPAKPTATGTVVACEVTFTDVPESHTFYTFIRCLACQGIINGYPCGGDGEPCDQDDNPYFRSGNNITRGQLTKIVAISGGYNGPVTGQTFEDVQPGTAFYTYTEQLVADSVMGGYPCGQVDAEPCNPPENRPYFRPGNNATRGQLTKIVALAAGFNDPAPATHTFTDVPTGHTFHANVEALLTNRPGAISGYTCGADGEPCDDEDRNYFRPNNTLTRGQASKIVANTFFPECSVR